MEETPSHTSFNMDCFSTNPQLLGRVLEHHRPYLRMLARARIHQELRSKLDPSDVVQEVCMEAVRQIQLFRGTSKAEFAGWLRGILADRIAKNARRFLGTQQRDIQLEKSLQQQLDETSGNLESFLAQSSRSPSAVAEWNETTLSLAQAIESLPDDYQQVVILRNLQGKSFREVADALNRSVDSVEKLWIRALVKLKQAMNG
jgi:RNA polymerase sigma-70 factor (ECF subfamily)